MTNYCADNKVEKRFSNAPIKKRIKFGGRRVISRAFVKPGSTNLYPNLHVRSGDTVMLMTGSEKAGRGKTGKVVRVFPHEGKIIVEGLNMITRAVKSRNPMMKSGHVKREGKIFASRVQLYCTTCKKPVRAGHKFLANGKKTRVCKKCNESFDS